MPSCGDIGVTCQKKRLEEKIAELEERLSESVDFIDLQDSAIGYDGRRIAELEQSREWWKRRFEALQENHGVNTDYLPNA